MLRTILFVFLIYLTFAFQLTNLPNPQMPKLDNYTGKSISPSMVTFFTKLINDGYTFYLTDLQNNAQYIQKKIQGAYSCQANVIIMPDNVSASYFIYNLNAGTSIVSWTSVNVAQPRWSYIISLVTKPSDSTNNYANSFFVGKGISSQTVTVVNNLLIQQEAQYSSCFCQQMDTLRQKLRVYDGKPWSIVCNADRSYYITGWIRNNGNQYLQIGDGLKCIYLLWVA